MSDVNRTPELQIIVPVHNEAESIGATLREWHQELSRRVTMEFVVCEDGSTDDTTTVLTELSEQFPLRLLTAPGRKGYARAVLDGLTVATAPFILAIDGDGQLDPKDFWSFWERRHQHDVTIGWRIARADPVFRRAMSRAFRMWYRVLFTVPVHDPSCPFVLMQQRAVRTLVPRLGVLRQGIWWEVTARAAGAGLNLAEIPIRSRRRAAGGTRVWKPRKLPGIVVAHGLGLIRIWLETRSSMR